MNDIFKKQFEFQKVVGFPIDSVLEHDRDEMSEKYVLKMIEEIIEFRKEFPSVANPWSKHQKIVDEQRIIEELSDVFLFFSNLLIAWHITWEEFIEQVRKTQTNNFNKIKEKKMALLNADILKVPNRVSGIGQGSLSPDWVFVGQNPGKEITQGYKFWSDPEDGSSQILLPILKELEIENCYFTNIVKCVTLNNTEPDADLTKFYLEFYEKEIEILKINNPDVVIVGMGKWVEENIPCADYYIKHPATVLYGTSLENYSNHVKEILK